MLSLGIEISLDFFNFFCFVLVLTIDCNDVLNHCTFQFNLILYSSKEVCSTFFLSKRPMTSSSMLNAINDGNSSSLKYVTNVEFGDQ